MQKICYNTKTTVKKNYYFVAQRPHCKPSNMCKLFKLLVHDYHVFKRGKGEEVKGKM